jgi:hypothetical protein
MSNANSEPPGLEVLPMREVLDRQLGVISRRQLVELGAHEWDVRRLLRRSELHQVEPGVYVNHNGPLTHPQREWVAVLAHWPAALTHESVLARGNEGDTVHLAPSCPEN